jgi:hypothetical protein
MLTGRTEGFNFPVSGPYQEFPILRNYNANPYTGGSPGADRVIFTTSCQLAGVITRKSTYRRRQADANGLQTMVQAATPLLRARKEDIWHSSGEHG